MNSTTMSHLDSSDLVSLRNFVVDDDRANLGADLWKSLDKNSFILAQRDAFEAFNLARAIRLSEESAANEERLRRSSTSHQSSSSSRPVLKRDPPTADSLPQKLPSASDPSHQKRRKASVSQSYSYSSHNQSTAGPVTSQASVHAQQHAEARKHSPSSSASSRDIQAGQILNPKESSPRTQSPSSSASAQAAAAEREREREKGREKEKERSRSNSSSHSSSTRKRSSSSAAHHHPQPQPQPQVQVSPPTQSQPQPQTLQGPRDIFAPPRFNCTKCGNLIASTVNPQPSLALTSPDPFAHPFASALHVICNTPSCAAVHCRGCLQAVKCRDVDPPSSASDSQALVPISSSPSASNPASPTRPTFTSSKSHQHSQAHSQRACAGGPGCALWSCCPTVRVIAISEALRAFDALFGAEAGLQFGSQQGRAGQGQGELGRQYRDAYVRMVISKADKTMRKFEDGFMRVLKVVASWLQVPAESSAQLGGDSRRQSTILDPDQQSQSSDLLLHVARLLLSSNLLEVMHTFLSNRNVKDWMTHAETYLDVLEVVKKLMDCGLGFLLKEVTGPPSMNSTALSSGFYNPFASSSSTSSSPSQSPPLVPLTLSSSSTSVTLYDLISQLESYRGELKKFLTKVSFGVTVDKASKLHEAITYLVLQLVVGEF